MEQQKQTTRPRPNETREPRFFPPPQTGDLARQVAGWGDVARQARARIQTGDASVQELQRRHNTSGE